MDEERRCLLSVRRWVAVFLIGLVLSGVTAFPLVHEVHWLVRLVRPLHALALQGWVQRVSVALDRQAEQAPFLAYGTDWLAFGHLVIAAAFLGLWNDPVRNRWLATWGLIACAGVVPLALIAGPVRGIPPYWRMIDCSFGVLAACRFGGFGGRLTSWSGCRPAESPPEEAGFCLVMMRVIAW